MNHSRSILRTSPICFGATKNFTVLLSSASGVRLTRSTKALEDFSYVAITSGNVAGAGAILPNSIPPSSACSLAFCSVTNIHASSFAALHLACGFRSDLAAGYALSTRIVVESSFSSWLRNCSFSLMVSSPLRGRGFRRVRLVLPPPGVHQPLRRFHHPVHPDQVMLGADPCRVKPARTSTAFAAALSSRHDLHDRTLDSGTRRVPRPGRGPSGHASGGRAPVSGGASPPAVRPRCARSRAPGERRRLPSRARARRPPGGAAGLGQHRLAQRRLSGLRGLHGDTRIRGCVGAAARAGARPADGDPVRGSRAVALPPPADRRCAGCPGGGGGPHPRRHSGGSASAVGARPDAPGGAAALSRRPARPDRGVLAPVRPREP